jgi:hypothetical protein
LAELPTRKLPFTMLIFGTRRATFQWQMANLGPQMELLIDFVTTNIKFTQLQI